MLRCIKSRCLLVKLLLAFMIKSILTNPSGRFSQQCQKIKRERRRQEVSMLKTYSMRICSWRRRTSTKYKHQQKLSANNRTDAIKMSTANCLINCRRPGRLVWRERNIWESSSWKCKEWKDWLILSNKINRSTWDPRC